MVKLSFFNPLPDSKILDWSNLKQIADDILSALNPITTQCGILMH